MCSTLHIGGWIRTEENCGYMNSSFIADGGDDQVFVELRVEKGKDVVTVKAVR